MQALRSAFFNVVFYLNLLFFLVVFFWLLFWPAQLGHVGD